MQRDNVHHAHQRNIQGFTNELHKLRIIFQLKLWAKHFNGNDILRSQINFAIAHANKLTDTQHKFPLFFFSWQSPANVAQ